LPPQPADTTTFTLAAPERDAALAFLGRVRAQPDIGTLVALIRDYTERVPWESASRIARRAATRGAAGPRWPGEFWREARTLGTGGTCFESNAAFVALLRALGYDCYLTINDMRGNIGVHTAIIVRIGTTRWIVDVGMPLYGPLPLSPDAPTTARAPFHTYTVTPEVRNSYTITRDRHPNPYCFTLRDEAIPDADYRAATAADYGTRGLFFDRVILLKVVEGRVSRFDSAAAERGIERFRDGERTLLPLPDTDPADALAAHFRTDAAIIRAALAAA
jgi:arylamine N-acetyltransferase